MAAYTSSSLSLLDTIGNTPLVKVDLGTPPHIYAKLECFNPSGSIKDRVAHYILTRAERQGNIIPGTTTLIEASSGNQGIAVALFGALRGYNVVITVTNKISAEKKATLQAYGAEVITCPTTPSLEDAQSYYSQAQHEAAQRNDSFFVNQYYNPENVEAHYTSLGPEIWEQTQGTITHFCGGIGSGGTVVGTGRYLKECNRDVTIIGVDAACSFRSTGGHPRPYSIEGMGVDFDTPHIKNGTIDTYLTVNDEEAGDMLRHFARNYGLLLGPASGGVIAAMQRYTRHLTANDTVVMLCGDSGRAYLSRYFIKE